MCLWKRQFVWLLYSWDLQYFMLISCHTNSAAGQAITAFKLSMQINMVLQDPASLVSSSLKHYNAFQGHIYSRNWAGTWRRYTPCGGPQVSPSCSYRAASLPVSAFQSWPLCRVSGCADLTPWHQPCWHRARFLCDLGTQTKNHSFRNVICALSKACQLLTAWRQRTSILNLFYSAQRVREVGCALRFLIS